MLLIILIPLIINELFKAKNGYLTMWSADVALNYCATIMGAVATIAAVLLTIKYSEKRQRYDRIEQIRPLLDCIASIDNDVKNFSNSSIFAFVYLHFKEIYCRYEFENKYQTSIQNNESLFIKLDITNVGGGSALLIKLVVDGKIAAREFNIRADSDKAVGIVIDKSYMDNPMTNINIDLLYRNVDGSEYYKQSQLISFQKVKDDFLMININDRVNSQSVIPLGEYRKS